ncbi:MAG TPA: rhomboid family intramembrane serine protease [Gemmatimonadaceae bacterium]|nr:rhomboid family intramembrane serine protease [Gemmatimonadaceae bacterium]
MIPLSDELPSVRTPWMTYAILALMFATWFFVQGAGFDQMALAASVCNLGMVPGELSHLAPIGTAVPLARDVACVVDNDQINVLTPLISMFLHGSWAHLLGNALFFWVFGNNIEDSLGHFRFLVFYLVCGLAAAFAHVISQPASPLPTVGASGAISGILGAYLVLYPKVRVRMLFFFIIFFKVIPIPAWLVLLWWFFWQLVAALPELARGEDLTGGVAVWAHVGGFVAGVLLVKLFENRHLVVRRVPVNRPASSE